MRGEHTDGELRRIILEHGSSPHAWGTRGIYPGLGQGGIHGSSPHAWGTPSIPQHVVASVLIRGSSPHAWGTRRNPIRCGYPLTPVHPHMRGQHDTTYTCCCESDPVHPHMRGEHFFSAGVRREGCWTRFIPTCVGNTHSAASCSGSLAPVHPHMRGGKHWCVPSGLSH